MNEKPSAPTVAGSAEAHKTSSGGDYPSNPLTTAKQAVVDLWKNGRTALAAFLVVQVVLLFFTAAFFAIAVLSLVASLVASLYGAQASAATFLLLTPELSNLLEGINVLQGAGSIVALVCGIVAIILGNFMNAFYFAYVGTAVAHNRMTKFSEIAKLAFKRSWALLGQAALVMAVALVVLLVPTLLAGPFITTGGQPNIAAGLLGLLYIVLGAAALFLWPRFVFASFALVNDNMGPIKSLKYSWNISRGRVWEILGAISVGFIALLAISLLFTLAKQAVTANNGLVLTLALLEFLIGAVTSLGFIAVIAMRYKQAKVAIASHKVNYGLNIAMFALALVVIVVVGTIQNTLNPPVQLNGLNQQSDATTEGSFDGSLPSFSDQELQQELNEWYEESQRLQEQYESQLQNYDSGNYESLLN